MSKRYDKRYLRIPIPGGRDPLIEVDPARVTLNCITQYWSKIKERTGIREVPVTGVDSGIDTNLDVSDLKEVIQSYLAATKVDLSTFPEMGSMIGDLIIEPLEQFSEILQHVAAGETVVAQRKLEGVLDNLQGSAHVLAQQLEIMRSQVDGQSQAIDHLDATIRNDHVLADELILKWGIAATEIVKSTSELKAIETRYGDVDRHLHSVMDRDLERLRSGAIFMVESLEWFEDFVLASFPFLQTPDTEGVIIPLLPEAKDRITSCRSLKKEIDQKKESLKGKYYEDAIEDLKRVAEFCVDLEKATTEFQEHERRFGELKGALKPYEYQGEGIIDKSTYEAAQLLSKDPIWGPRSAQIRISGLISRVMEYLDLSHELPLDVQKAIGRVGDAIREVERVNLLVAGEICQKVPVSAPIKDNPEINRTYESNPSASGQDLPHDEETDFSPERIEEFYEMVICVGYVLTCKRAHFAQSNVRAMLHVLRHLNRCSKDQIAALAKPVNDATHRKGERVRHEEGTNKVSELWKTSNRRWISYAIRSRTNCLKLTLSQEALAKQLLIKHSLTEEEIRQAHEARKEEKLQETRNRKKNESDDTGVCT